MKFYGKCFFKNGVDSSRRAPGSEFWNERENGTPHCAFTRESKNSVEAEQFANNSFGCTLQKCLRFPCTIPFKAHRKVENKIGNSMLRKFRFSVRVTTMDEFFFVKNHGTTDKNHHQNDYHSSLSLSFPNDSFRWTCLVAGAKIFTNCRKIFFDC